MIKEYIFYYQDLLLAFISTILIIVFYPIFLIVGKTFCHFNFHEWTVDENASNPYPTHCMRDFCNKTYSEIV